VCLAIPGKLLERWEDESGTPFGKLAFGTVRREVCLAYTPEAEIGAYLIVHVGFAIQILDEQAALEALALWREIGEGQP
jgi:hydrogenase expression/formation protein HypC